MAAGMVISQESVVDRRLEDLLAKLVADKASPAEREEIAKLTKRRSMLMYSPALRPSRALNRRRHRLVEA
ncbi:hypothetical protein [Methylorubrum sp. SB2]|uniref:hypothetical protein n=1 Tax=Methylorubrum subtropicum TaxID=3138812 RepID=UPI00313D6C50